MSAIEVDIAVITFNADVLVCYRHADATLGGYWEFPGGKREAGESGAECVVREVREEVGIEIEVIRDLPANEHRYAHGLIRLQPFLCHLKSGVPTPIGCQKVEWTSPESLRNYRFPPANASIIDDVIRALGEHRPAD